MSGGGRPGGAGMSVGGQASGAGMSGADGRTEYPTRLQCGVMEVHRRLLSTSPEYAAARSALETATIDYVSRQQRFTGIARIPVVVHVVWNSAAQNISQAQIDSQLDVLNRDYRATNPDTSIVPPVFSGLIADARVEFFLATEDPNGNPATGVTRTQTSTASFGTDDLVKSSATGGSDPWPADRYLNIWVCQLGGGLLGYAQFPGGPANTDGVVILRYRRYGDRTVRPGPDHDPRGRPLPEPVPHLGRRRQRLQRDRRVRRHPERGRPELRRTDVPARDVQQRAERRPVLRLHGLHRRGSSRSGPA